MFALNLQIVARFLFVTKTVCVYMTNAMLIFVLYLVKILKKKIFYFKILGSYIFSQSFIYSQLHSSYICWRTWTPTVNSRSITIFTIFMMKNWFLPFFRHLYLFHLYLPLYNPSSWCDGWCVCYVYIHYYNI